MISFDLTGKVAVVTGASSGLGQQFARALSEQGCDVAILARRKERLEEFSKVLKMRLKLSSIILEKLIFLSIMQVLLNTQVVFMIIQQPNGIKF
jgi:NAD(P)-dependent dehydrogenase (short-subunit alcohol dehydrogenase family)